MYKICMFIFICFLFLLSILLILPIIFPLLNLYDIFLLRNAKIFIVIILELLIFVILYLVVKKYKKYKINNKGIYGKLYIVSNSDFLGNKSDKLLYLVVNDEFNINNLKNGDLVKFEITIDKESQE